MKEVSERERDQPLFRKVRDLPEAAQQLQLLDLTSLLS